MVQRNYIMRIWIALVTAYLSLNYGESAILFPEEISTLSSFVYSLLPPIKIGQDSRFGIGFRLGRNADAQFLIELGPQQNTEPLGNGSEKREIANNTRRALSPAEREKLLRKWLDKIKSSELVESKSQSNISTTARSTNDTKIT